MSASLLWRSTSRFHDWNDGRFVTTLLTRAVEIGVLERVDWIATEANGDRQSVRLDDRAALPSELVKRVPRKPVRYLEAGGDAPAPWSIQILIAPYIASERRVYGMDVVALLFDGRAFESNAGSSRLATTFRETHTLDDTEYAGIHWYERWMQLNNSTYDPAVTYTPMFSGVVWANFLGRGHLEQFDRHQLAALPPSQASWIGSEGLVLVADASLEAARGEPIESELARLTQIFRRARK